MYMMIHKGEVGVVCDFSIQAIPDCRGISDTIRSTCGPCAFECFAVISSQKADRAAAQWLAAEPFPAQGVSLGGHLWIHLVLALCFCMWVREVFALFAYLQAAACMHARSAGELTNAARHYLQATTSALLSAVQDLSL